MPADYDGFSSPDPLNSSTCTGVGTVPTKKRIPFSTTRQSGTARRSLNNTSILSLSSPSRTVAEQTLSPWKIRVTVEAEPEDQENGTVQTTTMTMKVPLREEASPVQKKPNKRSQSRSRAGSVSSGQRRSATPTSERRRRQSVTDLDIVVLGDDADEDEWGKPAKKTSPKKSRAPKGALKQPATKATQSQIIDFEVRHDTDAEEGEGVAIREDSPELRQIDLNRVSVRSRANSTKQNMQHPSEIERGDAEPQKLKPFPAARRTVSANSAMTYPTPSPTASERGHSVEADEGEQQSYEHAEGFDTIMESEGFTMIDLESLPSVKQMLSSPPELQIRNSTRSTVSPSASESSVLRHTTVPTSGQNLPQTHSASALPPYLVLPEGESDISSTAPSSPPSFQPRIQPLRQKSPLDYLQVPVQPRNRVVTPQPYDSPKLPSPPRQITSKDRSTPDSAKALKAAMVLQGAIKSPNLYPVLPTSAQPVLKEISHSRSSSDELFEGFDSGTKRELRAGLRFGEELARRQASNTSAASFHIPQSGTQPASIWRGESTISRTPVQIQSNASQKDDEVILKQGTTSHAAPNIQPIDRPLPDTESKREYEWQLERKVISKQIEDASSSKVIVIESDGEDSVDEPESEATDRSTQDVTMEDDGADIWLEEAKDASSSPRPEQDESGPASRMGHQYHDAQLIQEKPRRTLVRSPWNREQIDQTNNSTIITNGDEFSGILWDRQAQDEVKFGAAAISNIRKELKKSGAAALTERRGSGTFDIEKMLGTPKRIRESLDREQTRGQKSSHVEQRSIHQAEHDIEQDAIEDDEYDEAEDGSTSSTTSTISNTHPQKIPVNFNDSIAPQSQTPSPTNKARVSVSPSAARPPTPRSAMKGSRQSFGAATGLGLTIDEADVAARRVIFAGRSKGVNVDWVESSSSIRSSADDFASSPIVEHQKHHEERLLVHTSSQVEPDSEHDFRTEPHVIHQTEDEEAPSRQDQTINQAQTGWLSWFRKGERSEPSATTTSSSAHQVDGSSEPTHCHPLSKEPTNTIWAPTSRHDSANNQIKVQPRPASQVLSYLLPPSYPSDPTRNPTIPLSTFGHFTNTHFRTLHILHRKSQRPRFHAPTLNTCRPEIRTLVTQKWQLEVDESSAGLGGFAWTVGATEARVLERFCREVEFGHLSEGLSERETAVVMDREWTTTDGIWGGNMSHGRGVVRWEWTVTQLATWLGRVVVGEVVRAEEFGAGKA